MILRHRIMILCRGFMILRRRFIILRHRFNNSWRFSMLFYANRSSFSAALMVFFYSHGSSYLAVVGFPPALLALSVLLVFDN